MSVIAPTWSPPAVPSRPGPAALRGEPRPPTGGRSTGVRRAGTWLGLALSLGLHGIAILWLASVSLRSAAEAPPILRVAILSPTEGGSQAGGGPPVGPPPVPESRPAPVAPAPVAPPKKPAARREPVAKPAARVPPQRAMERPAAVTSAPAEVDRGGAVEEGAAIAAGSSGAGAPGTGTGAGTGTGDGRGSGRGGSGTGRGPGSPLGAYLARVRQRIEGAKKYPLLARRTRLEGRAAVAFELDRSGEPQRVELRYADHPLLGEAALLAVRSASPFGRLPDEVDDERVRVEVPLRFSLRDQ